MKNFVICKFHCVAATIDDRIPSPRSRYQLVTNSAAIGILAGSYLGGEQNARTQKILFHIVPSFSEIPRRVSAVHWQYMPQDVDWGRKMEESVRGKTKKTNSQELVFWRRVWDSNPRDIAAKRFSRLVPFRKYSRRALLTAPSAPYFRDTLQKTILNRFLFAHPL